MGFMLSLSLQYPMGIYKAVMTEFLKSVSKHFSSSLLLRVIAIITWGRLCFCLQFVFLLTRSGLHWSIESDRMFVHQCPLLDAIKDVQVCVIGFHAVETNQNSPARWLCFWNRRTWVLPPFTWEATVCWAVMFLMMYFNGTWESNNPWLHSCTKVREFGSHWIIRMQNFCPKVSEPMRCCNGLVN